MERGGVRIIIGKGGMGRPRSTPSATSAAPISRGRRRRGAADTWIEVDRGRHGLNQKAFGASASRASARSGDDGLAGGSLHREVTDSAKVGRDAILASIGATE
jgi:hypothetical protein